MEEGYRGGRISECGWRGLGRGGGRRRLRGSDERRKTSCKSIERENKDDMRDRGIILKKTCN